MAKVKFTDPVISLKRSVIYIAGCMAAIGLILHHDSKNLSEFVKSMSFATLIVVPALSLLVLFATGIPKETKKIMASQDPIAKKRYKRSIKILFYIYAIIQLFLFLGMILSR